MSIRSSISKTVTALLVAGAALLSVSKTEAVTFDYSSTVSNFITFAGDTTFSFTAAPDTFKVTSGSASGFFGDITGTFTMGAVTTVGPLSTASVSGTGSLSITDSHGFTLNATLTWADIQQLGTGSSLNVNGAVNLTGITYGGTNSDLVSLAKSGSAVDVLSFQFNPTVTLASLKGSSNQTSFSGTIAAAPDGGATICLLGLGLLAIGTIGRKIKSVTA